MKPKKRTAKRRFPWSRTYRQQIRLHTQHECWNPDVSIVIGVDCKKGDRPQTLA